MNILISTIVGEIYRGEACAVVATSSNGELKILPNHAPLLAVLRPGIVRVDCMPDCHCPDVKCDEIVVLGGFMEVQPDAVTILADAAERSQDIDDALADKAVQQARDQVQRATPEDAGKALLALDLAIARLAVVRKSRRKH